MTQPRLADFVKSPVFGGSKSKAIAADDGSILQYDSIPNPAPFPHDHEGVEHGRIAHGHLRDTSTTCGWMTTPSADPAAFADHRVRPDACIPADLNIRRL